MSTKKNCELCNKPARMFCESDQASLCISCDEMVHAANFLVAKHARTLLCHACGSPTAWSAQGPKLGLTVSVCHGCSGGRRGGNNTRDGGRRKVAAGGDFSTASTSSSCAEGIEEDDELYSDEESDDDQYGDDEDDEISVYGNEEGENQVVPWSEEDATWRSNDSFDSKRVRDCDDDAFVESEDEDGCCSSHRSYDLNNSFQGSDDDDESSALGRPLKIRRRNEEAMSTPSSGTAAIVDELQSFQQEITKLNGD